MAIDRLPTWSTADYERLGEPRTRMLVATTDGRCRPGDRTFLVVQGFRSWIEPFEMQRFQLLANVLRARLIVVEVPGFGAAASRLLPREQRALFAGDFGPLAGRMFDAARAVLDDDERDEPMSFLGYSMGASVAAAMANHAVTQRYMVDQLVLVEPVALYRWRLRKLLWATRREDRLTDGYVSANDAVDGAVAPWDRRPGERPKTYRYQDLLLLGSALRRGGLAAELLALRRGPHRLIVVRGGQSALSRADFAPTMARLRGIGIGAVELTVEGHHAFWHSLPAVGDMARRLKAVLDARE